MRTLFLIVLIVQSGWAQRDMLLFDEFDQPVSEQEFNRPRDRDLFMTLFYRNDSTSIGKIFRRDEYATIEPSQLEEVRRFLEHASGRTVRRDHYLIINYYHRQSYEPSGSCFRNYVRDKKYKRFLKQQEQVSQFFVTSPDFRTQEPNIVHDAENIIGRAMFRWSMDCGSFVIVSPNGTIFRHWGEYRQDDIPKRLIDLQQRSE